MKIQKTLSGVMLLLIAAGLGFALVFLPTMIISQYETLAAFGEIWGILYLVVVGLGLLLLLGSAGWIVWKLWGASAAKARRRKRRNLNPSEMSLSQREREIDENVEQIESLKADASEDPELASRLSPMLKELETKREAQTLEIVAFGTISSGKSSVLNLLAGRDVFATDATGGTTVNRNEIPWPGIDKVTLVDTPGLGEIDGEQHVAIAADSAQDADLIMVVVDGPLRESEHDLLERLGQMEKRVLICLNKSDWYSDEDRSKLVGQISRQTNGFVQEHDIVSIQAQTGHRIRRKVLADGTTTEETVEIAPDISALADRMVKIVKQDGKDLLMANLLLQSRGMVEKARTHVQDALDDRAWDIVEKYMWTAGGVSALSPFPMVDLAAGSAISTKMIVDLADVYQQQVDLHNAAKWLGEMGKKLIGLLGAHGAAVAVTSVVASLIKGVPIAGTIAGGVMQGAVQALITKWIGAVFIEYFRNEMQTPEGGLAGLARRQWELVTAADELRKLVQSARQKLSGEDDEK
ncbi:MAG: GTP-binding protein [Planctomycetota bacterium]